MAQAKKAAKGKKAAKPSSKRASQSKVKPKSKAKPTKPVPKAKVKAKAKRAPAPAAHKAKANVKVKAGVPVKAKATVKGAVKPSPKMPPPAPPKAVAGMSAPKRPIGASPSPATVSGGKAPKAPAIARFGPAPRLIAPSARSTASVAASGPVWVPQAADLAAFRDKLEKKRQDIIAMYERDLRSGQEASDENTDDIVDRANNAYSRELMFSLSDTERSLLQKVDQALGRLDAGTFGACVHCKRPISRPRLDALPWARLCIDCQELQEKGLLEES